MDIFLNLYQLRKLNLDDRSNLNRYIKIKVIEIVIKRFFIKKS